MFGTVVALTFDDGPTLIHGSTVLEILRTHGAKATFFICGRDAEQEPNLLKTMLMEGHELGNHSWSHKRMVLQTWSTVKREVENTDAVIRTAGQHGHIHFRPPYCAKLFVLPAFLRLTGRSTVTWDVEPDSPLRARALNREEIVSAALIQTQPGSIILLHAMFKHNAPTREALPPILEGLSERGFSIVTVSELLSKAMCTHDDG